MIWMGYRKSKKRQQQIDTHSDNTRLSLNFIWYLNALCMKPNGKHFWPLEKITCIPLDDTDYTFCQLMSCVNGDLEVGKEFCNFLNACFNIRTEAIKEIQEKKILCRPESTITRLGRVSKRPIRMYLYHVILSAIYIE